MKQILLIIFLGASVSATAQILSLSFDDALRQMQQGNRSLKIADKGIETARTERDKLNALWYPSLQGAGTFVHLSEKIEVSNRCRILPTLPKTLSTTSYRTTNLSAVSSTR